MNPLISIIVPIYNVEKYLKKCINSLIIQTYRNCEIILVDDGSTDGCPKICDEFAERDSRIKVIHKSNGGLSDARNNGVRQSSGEYIVFVDSDDCVADDCVEYLWGLLYKYNADISIAGKYVVNENGTIYTTSVLKTPKQNMVLNAHDAVKEACYGRYVGVNVCSILYKKKIVDQYPFPRGRIHEDLYVALRFFGSSKKTVIGTEKKYFYLKRADSICRASDIQRRLIDTKYACNQICQIESDFPDLKKALINRCVRAYVSIMPSAVKTKDFVGVRCIAVEIRPYVWSVITDKQTKKIFKLAVLATVSGGKVSLVLWNIAIKKKGI